MPTWTLPPGSARGIGVQIEQGQPAPAIPAPTPGEVASGLIGQIKDRSALQGGLAEGAPGYMAQVPQIKMPDYNSLPQIQSFAPKITEAGRLKLESGLAALRSGYGQQAEELESQLTAAGTYDSGDKYKLQQKMFEGRSSQESQLIYNIQAETLANEVAEMQRVGNLTEERARLMMGQEFDAAIQQGNWQQAAAIHNADMNMQIKQYNQQSLELEAKLIDMGLEAQLKWSQDEIERIKLDLQARGLDIEEHKVEVAALETKIKGCIANNAAGSNVEAVQDCIGTAELEFDSAVSPLDEEEAGGVGGDGGTGVLPTDPNAPAVIGGRTLPVSNSALEAALTGQRSWPKELRQLDYMTGPTMNWPANPGAPNANPALKWVPNERGRAFLKSRGYIEIPGHGFIRTR